MPDPATSALREELHLLLDHIPDTDVATTRKILRALIDPVELALLVAPPDNEPLSAHEQAATEEAERRERLGEPLITHEEILREYGLAGHKK